MSSTATTTLALTIEMPELSGSSSWNALEALVVQMGKDVPRQALAEAPREAQERLIDGVCGDLRRLVDLLLVPRQATLALLIVSARRTTLRSTRSVW